MSPDVVTDPSQPTAPSLFRRISSVPLAGVIFALIVIFVASCFLSEHFLTPYNLTIMERTLAFIGIVTLGQALLLILGELDLSLGAIAGLCAVVGGILMVQMGIDPWVSFAACLVLGTVCGVVNGLLVTRLRLHSLVLTIGMAGVYGGANLVVTKGVAITGIPNEIAFLGKGAPAGIPVPFMIMVVLLAAVSFLAFKTPFGRYVYAIGNNPNAARMLGIRVDTIRVCVFALAGFLSALAGMLMVARLGTSQPSIGESWVLPPIAASVIGGVATTGGIGSPIGAIFGAAIIGIIENIIVLFGVSPYWQSVVSGAIVVLAISFDSISRRYLRREE